MGTAPSSRQSETPAGGSYVIFKTASKFMLGDHHQITKGKSLYSFLGGRSGRKTRVSLGTDYNYAAWLHPATRMESTVSPGRRGGRLGEQPAGLFHA